MSRADRAFAAVLVAAVASGAILLVPLLITVFPGELQRLLHGPRELAFACAAALYQLGAALPPLGVVVLALAGLSLAHAIARLRATLWRTRALLSLRERVPAPRRLRRAAARVGVGAPLVCYADAQPAAFSVGLIRPAVWVSTGTVRRLRAAELEAVLAHEAHHARCRDPLRLLVARTLGVLLFALPWVGALAEWFAVAAELEADRVAIAARGRRAVAGALYALGTPFPAHALAVGAWSVSHARVAQLAESGTERPPGVSRAVWLRSAAGLALAVGLTVGQAARANLIPAAAVEAVTHVADGGAHACPIPLQGLLL